MKQEAITLLEWQKRYSEEEACIEHLVAVRWPEGFCCPYCEGKDSWYTFGHGLYECKTCRKRTSATAGTLFHSTKIPLSSWF